MNHSRTSLLAIVVALSGLSVPALAQDAPATVEPVAEGLGEIVVTAEKRQSTAQKTPIAMTVATGAQLTASGVTDVNGLTNVAPTLSIAQNNQNTLITIRGVSSRDYTETGNPAVALSIDNFYLQNGTALNVGFFDLERIEVLRGPQGTLYGRNATAGAINIQTAKPKDALEGNFALEYGNKNALIAEGMVNLPINDVLKLRAAFSVHQRDAFRDNGSLRSNSGLVTRGGNDDVSQAARIHLAYDPTSSFSALLSGEYTHVGGVGAVLKGVPYSDVVNGELKIGSETDWALNNQGSIDLTIRNLRWNFNYDFGPATLSYFGGYREQDLSRMNDQDGTDTINFAFPTDGTTKTQNHELRLASNGNGPFGWQTGVYYFKEQGQALTYFQVLGGATPFNFYTFDYDTGSRSYAGFGQAWYEVAPGLKIEAGARYTKEKKTQVGYNDIAGTYSTVNARYSGGKDTYHVGVNWQATPDHLAYAKFDTGFKAGGFQNGFTFGPETIQSYEAGLKNRFFDRTLQVNLSGFYYNYTDLQVQQNDPATAISRVFNAGRAKIYGSELETTWLPTPDDHIDLNVAWLHARYSDFFTGGVQYAGNTLPQAPTWSLSGGYSHDFQLASGTLTARIQSRYQTKSFFSFRNFETEKQDSYTKTDFLLTYAPEDAKGLSVSAYVRNIENSVILTTSEEAGYAGGYLVQFADPRTFGVRLGYAW